MTDFPMMGFRLSKRVTESGGLVCDPDGVMLGPAPLVFADREASGSCVFRAVSAPRLAELLSAAYGPDFKADIAYRATKLSAIAQALTERRYAEAAIGTLHLRLPELATDAVARLTPLDKYSADQPRVPAGQPDGGQWTSGNGAGGGGHAGTRSATSAAPHPAHGIILVSSRTAASTDTDTPRLTGDSQGDQRTLDEMAVKAVSPLLPRSRQNQRLYLGFIYLDPEDRSALRISQIASAGSVDGPARAFTQQLWDSSFSDVHAPVVAAFVTHYSNILTDPINGTETFTARELIAATGDKIQLYVATPSGRIITFDGRTQKYGSVGTIRRDQ